MHICSFSLNQSFRFCFVFYGKLFHIWYFPFLKLNPESAGLMFHLLMFSLHFILHLILSLLFHCFIIILKQKTNIEQVFANLKKNQLLVLILIKFDFRRIFFVTAIRSHVKTDGALCKFFILSKQKPNNQKRTSYSRLWEDQVSPSASG